MTRKELRTGIKTLAADIKNTKSKMKSYQKKNSGWGGAAHDVLSKLQWDFRHKHIAASLMRGTPYDKIESPATDNEPNWDLIKEIQDACTPHVCAHAE